MDNGKIRKRQPERTIMVVDDSPVSRQLLEHALSDAGYRACLAEDALQALEMLQHQAVDGFLLDIEMPGMNGIELCRQLRALPAYKMTPILFITGLEEQSSLKDAFAAGGDDFVQKPADPVVLKVRLHGLLQKMDLYNQVVQIRRNLNRYISPRTQKMVEVYSNTGTLPPPQERKLCILFCDIRGFTTLSQEIEPATMFSVLSQQLGNQVDLVYQHGGYVDKFGGDGVMAIFDGPDMVLNGCLCALDIIDSTRESITLQGRQLMPLGIGIHYGSALIGNIGSAEHLDYSVIGTAVNIAARLCGQAKPMSVIASKQVRDMVENFPRIRFTEEKQACLRGVKEPVMIYEMTGNAAPFRVA